MQSVLNRYKKEILSNIVTHIFTIGLYITILAYQNNPTYGQNFLNDFIFIVVGWILIIVGIILSIVGWLSVLFSYMEEKEYAK